MTRNNSLANSIEMGVYPFTEEAVLDEAEEMVETSFGTIKVNIFGEKGKYPIVTFHDIGMDSINNFENFFQFQAPSQLSTRFCIYNINAPGQEFNAKKLPMSYAYPTMDGLAQIVEEVANYFSLHTFIGMGVGAGANMFLRYAVNFSNKLDALILVNATSQKAGWIEWFYQKLNLNHLWSGKLTQFTVDYFIWHHFGRHIEESNPEVVRQYKNYFQSHPCPWNLARYVHSFLSRSELILRDPKSADDFLLHVPILQIVGSNSAFCAESIYVNSQLNPQKTEWLKISGSSGLVLDDKPEEVLQAMLLFLQGLGFCSDINVPRFMSSLRNVRRGVDLNKTTELHAHVERVDEMS